VRFWVKFRAGEACQRNDLGAGTPYPFDFTRDRWTEISEDAVKAQYGTAYQESLKPDQVEGFAKCVERATERAWDRVSVAAKRNPLSIEISKKDPAGATPTAGILGRVREVAEKTKEKLTGEV